MRLLGPAAAVALCLVAFVVAVGSTLPYGPINALSIGFGAASLIAMSQCLVLAARPRFLEPLFGGLDRMYLVHKWLGIAALGAMVIHDLVEPDFEGWVRESLIGGVGGWLGQVAYYALIGLVLSSWIKRIPLIDWEIPWEFWWVAHRLTGAFFAIALLHQVLVDLPFGPSDPLTVMLNGFGLVGIASYLFVELLARAWRRRGYTVASVERAPDATSLTLRPERRPMRWRPGQFAFLSVPGIALGEAHPFTISGGAEASSLHFTIKRLGDWTRRVPPNLTPGDRVEVEGPYGQFDFRKGGARQVWIAGGVGITPFLAWARSLDEAERRRIHLLYSVTKAAEAVGLDVLTDAARRFPGFTFDLLTTERDGRLDAERLIARAPLQLDGADFFFCGPPALRRSILKGLKARGITPRRVRFEMFEFR